jgi:hypothetical protein
MRKSALVIAFLRVTAVAAAAVALSGCAAVLVGGLIYDHTRSREERKEFTENFNKQNLEREKAGLPKLDWCSECYKFSKSWAMDQVGCADRIRRYEAGDATALAM